MANETTNPNSGVALTEGMDETLRSANNLADLRDRVQALQNLMGHKATTCTVQVAAGAANVCTITITAKDANGATVTGYRYFDIVTTSDAAGTTVSSTAYSGTLAAVTGTIPITFTAKHAFRVMTDSTGVFVGSLTDTSKTADYIAVQKPISNGLVVSAPMAFG